MQLLAKFAVLVEGMRGTEDHIDQLILGWEAIPLGWSESRELCVYSEGLSPLHQLGSTTIHGVPIMPTVGNTKAIYALEC